LFDSLQEVLGKKNMTLAFFFGQIKRRKNIGAKLIKNKQTQRWQEAVFF